MIDSYSLWLWLNIYDSIGTAAIIHRSEFQNCFAHVLWGSFKDHIHRSYKMKGTVDKKIATSIHVVLSLYDF